MTTPPEPRRTRTEILTSQLRTWSGSPALSSMQTPPPSSFSFLWNCSIPISLLKMSLEATDPFVCSFQFSLLFLCLLPLFVSDLWGGKKGKTSLLGLQEPELSILICNSSNNFWYPLQRLAHFHLLIPNLGALPTCPPLDLTVLWVTHQPQESSILTISVLLRNGQNGQMEGTHGAGSWDLMGLAHRTLCVCHPLSLI